MDIKGNADIYLFFNDKNEPMCSQCFNHRFRARDVLIEYRDEPFAISSNGGQPLHIEVDGVFVRFGRAKCGNHDRQHSRGARISPSLLTNDRLLDFDLLRRAYIKHRDETDVRHAKEDASWRQHLLDVASMPASAFSVEYKVKNYDGSFEWVISGPTQDSTFRGISIITAAPEHGVWRVMASDYSGHVGKGRGAPSLTRIIARTMLQAADICEEKNREVK